MPLIYGRGQYCDINAPMTEDEWRVLGWIASFGPDGVRVERARELPQFSTLFTSGSFILILNSLGHRGFIETPEGHYPEWWERVTARGASRWAYAEGDFESSKYNLRSRGLVE